YRDGGCRRISDPCADVWPASRVCNRTVSYTSSLCRLLAGLHAGRHRWRRICAVDHGESAPAISHDDSNIVLRGGDIVGHPCRFVSRTRNSEIEIGMTEVTDNAAKSEVSDDRQYGH